MSPRHLKKHLCFILPATGTTNVGGMEVVAKDLFNNLDIEKYDFSLVCFEADNGIIQRIDRSRVNVQVIEKRAGLDRTMIPRLAAYFYATRPTLLHTFNFGGLVYSMPAAVLARVPAIVHADHGRMGVPEKRVARRTRIEMCKRVDHVVCVSEDLREILVREEGLGESQVSAIINGVDTGPFDAGDFDRAAYRTNLGFNLAPGDFVVGTVGAVSERKNQRLLVYAAAKVQGFKVMIAGKGPLESELKALIKDLKVEERVFLLGERSDIHRLTRAFDLFALPSKMEGTSLAILEAMAARLPVLATDVGGSAELVVDGETGFLVPSDDLKQLAERLSWCSTHREECIEMGRRGRERIDARFSFARTAEAYDDVFQSVMKAKGIL